MTDLSELADVLPDGTADAWRRIAPVVPPDAYLAGGTALAVHLHHRVSRDLDFFTGDDFDPDELMERISEVGAFAATSIEKGTLNGVLGRTKVQFLHADRQKILSPTTEVAGIQIAAMPDLLATKLKVIGDRGELRDYFDIMCIERDTDFTVEVGLDLFLERYKPRTPEANIAHIVRGLGYLEDVSDDPFLPTSKRVIESYWHRRQPQVLSHLSTVGLGRWALPSTSAQPREPNGRYGFKRVDEQPDGTDTLP